jgi:hypothetical protein
LKSSARANWDKSDKAKNTAKQVLAKVLELIFMKIFLEAGL